MSKTILNPDFTKKFSYSFRYVVYVLRDIALALPKVQGLDKVYFEFCENSFETEDLAVNAIYKKFGYTESFIILKEVVIED